ACVAWVTSDRYAAGPAPYPAWPVRAWAPVAPVASSAWTCPVSSARASSNSEGSNTAPAPAASSPTRPPPPPPPPSPPSPSRLPVSGEDEATSGLRSSSPRYRVRRSAMRLLLLRRVDPWTYFWSASSLVYLHCHWPGATSVQTFRKTGPVGGGGGFL